MSGEDINKAIERCLHWEAQMDEGFPGCWGALDAAREDPRGQERWPAWCILPTAEVDRVLSAEDDLPDDVVTVMVPQVAGMYAWRQARTVYRVPPQVATAFMDAAQALEDERAESLSLAAFSHLAGPGAYIAWPGKPAKLYGSFVHLDWEPATGRPQLRLLLDLDRFGPVEAMVAVRLFLDHPSLAEALHEAVTGLSASVPGVRGPSSRGKDDELGLVSTRLAHPVLMAALYLCSFVEDTRTTVERAGVRVVDIGPSLVREPRATDLILERIAA